MAGALFARYAAGLRSTSFARPALVAWTFLLAGFDAGFALASTFVGGLVCALVAGAFAACFVGFGAGFFAAALTGTFALAFGFEAGAALAPRVAGLFLAVAGLVSAGFADFAALPPATGFVGLADLGFALAAAPFAAFGAPPLPAFVAGFAFAATFLAGGFADFPSVRFAIHLASGSRPRLETAEETEDQADRS
jgi:hypothetical protein